MAAIGAAPRITRSCISNCAITVRSTGRSSTAFPAEAGAQGEHKLARGYLPSQTHSLHWVRDQGFQDAIADYLVREGQAISHEMAVLTEMGPFRRG